ncbi:MAG TPA: HAD family hydrolase [Acidimicrobiales bacterium]|nr:HAD family hydrolase [Acidimicrobiales bacterium]
MRAVLADVDGTLVDSNYHHALAWFRALCDHGHVIPLVDIHRRVGMGGSQMLEELIGHADEDIEADWRQNFEEMLPEIEPFARVADLLHACAGRGVRVVLATSAPSDLLAALRAKVDADDWIHAKVDADDVAEAKPEPDVFAAALAKAAVAASDAIVLGDSTWDVLAARRAGLGCVCVLSGGYGRAELLDAGAVAVYRDVAELLDAFDDSPLVERVLDRPSV